MCEVGRTSLRSKAYCLEKLDRELGPVRIRDLDRAVLLNFGMLRAEEGAGSVTLGVQPTRYGPLRCRVSGTGGRMLSALCGRV